LDSGYANTYIDDPRTLRVELFLGKERTNLFTPNVFRVEKNLPESLEFISPEQFMVERDARLQSHLNEIRTSSDKDISTIEKNFHNFLRKNYIVPELSSTLIDAYSLTVTSDPEKITITIS
jgi:predicted metal-dependent hydrolase